MQNMINSANSTTEVKTIGVVIFDGFDSLDVAGPNQVFYWLTQFSKANPIELYLIGPHKGKVVTSMEGTKWIPQIG